MNETKDFEGMDELRELQARISKVRARHRPPPRERSLPVIHERLRQRESVAEGLRNLYDYLLDLEMGEVAAPSGNPKDASVLHELGAKCEQLCQDLALPEIEQARAVMCLAGIHASTGEARVGQLFVQIINDVSRANEIRRQAYMGLFELAGRSALEWPDSDFNFPGDVDWPFVQRFV